MDFKEEIFKSIQDMVNRAVENCKVDRTYQSIIKEVTPKGYVILDTTGQERTVQCRIPKQSVYVKEPMGKLNEMYICNVIENTNNSARRNRSR